MNLLNKLKTLILTCTILATSASITKAVEGFVWYPCENSYYTIYKYKPIYDLIEAINERCVAVGIEEFTYTENVTIQIPAYSTNGWAEIWDGPYEDGTALVVGNPPIPYFFQIVPILETRPGPYGLEGLVEWDVPAEFEVYEVVNQWGEFVVTNDVGIVSTGQTFVTREIIDSMWDKVEELGDHFITKGTNDSLLGEVGSTSWVDSEEAIVTDYRVLAGDYNDAWGVKPRFINATLANTWTNYGIPVVSNQLDEWGITTNGIVEYYPPNDTNMYMGRIIIADAICTNPAAGQWKIDFKDHNGSVYWPAGPDPDYNPYNIDYKWYVGNTENTNWPKLVHISTNEGYNTNINVIFRGKTFVKGFETEEIVSTNWNKTLPIDSADLEFDTRTITNDIYTLTEAIGAGSIDEDIELTFIHFDPDSIVVEGTADFTNETVSLVWDVDHFYEDPTAGYVSFYRLYAEEFDRMAQALDAMRYSIFYQYERPDPSYINDFGPTFLGYADTINTNYFSTNSSIRNGEYAGDDTWVEDNQVWYDTGGPPKSGAYRHNSFWEISIPVIAGLGVVGGEYDAGQLAVVKNDPWGVQNSTRTKGIPAWWPATFTYTMGTYHLEESSVTPINRPPTLASLQGTTRSRILGPNGIQTELGTYPENYFYQYALPYALTIRILQNRSCEVVSSWDYLYPFASFTDYDLFGSASYYKENASYCDLMFNITIPSNTPAGTIYGVYGDFSATWDGARIQDASPEGPSLYKGTSLTGLSDETPTYERIDLETSDGRAPFKVDMTNPDMTTRLTALPMTFDGNGKLTDYNKLHVVEFDSWFKQPDFDQHFNPIIKATNDDIPNFGTRTLVRPAFDNPTANTFEHFADVDIQGYVTTHLYLIIKWDFLH